MKIGEFITYHKNIMLLFGILLLTFLVYSNTLHNNFVWDDDTFILNWQAPKLLQTNLVPLLKGDLPAEHIGVYRPLRSIFYAISYSLWGTSPFGYHLQAIILHLIATALVYYIAKHLTKNNAVGLLASLVFGLHPIHTEAISWIAASFDTLGMVLALAALAAYLWYVSSSKIIIYILSLLFSVLALLTNEMAVVIPLLIVISDLLLKMTSLKALIKRIQLYIPYILIVALFIWIRFGVFKIYGRFSYPFGDMLHSLLFAPLLIVKYAYLLLLPLHLTPNQLLAPGIPAFFWVDYFAGKQVLPISLTQPRILVPVIFLTIAIICWAYFLKKKPQISWNISWFLICLLPVLGILPQSSLFSEKYMYLASVGFSISLAWIVYFAVKKSKNLLIRTIILFIFLGLNIFYAVKTYTRNYDWHDDIPLWTKAVQDNPYSNSSYSNLGIGYFKVGDMDKAEEMFSKAINLNPNQPNDWTNIGMIYLKKGEIDNAKANLLQALSLAPGYQKAHTYLGIVYFQEGDTDKAIKEYEMAIISDPHLAEPYNYLGMIAHQQGNYDQALAYYQKSLVLKPDYADVYNNLGNVYRNLGMFDKALYNYQQALLLNPRHEFAGKNLDDISSYKQN